ncbi:protein of unknown function [Cyanobium sp. NIES-981]|nr:protein of unknown function [Cyanobium sp. NIES-981]
MVEWLMAPVLKTGDPQGSVGSNPTLSVLQMPVPAKDLRGSPAVMGVYRDPWLLCRITFDS